MTNTNKTIALFGASGTVGRLVVSDALSQGYTIRAFAHRHPNFDTHPNLTVVTGDIHSEQDVKEAIQGADVVISTLGSWGSKNKDVLTAGMKTIIPVMHSHGITRIVSLTGADARASGDRDGVVHWISHAILSVVAKKILQDGENHISLLESSGLDWTVIRSPIMNNGSSSVYRLDSHRPLPWQTVSRHAVASALLSEATNRHDSQEAPYIR